MSFIESFKEWVVLNRDKDILRRIKEGHEKGDLSLFWQHAVALFEITEEAQRQYQDDLGKDVDTMVATYDHLFDVYSGAEPGFSEEDRLLAKEALNLHSSNRVVSYE